MKWIEEEEGQKIYFLHWTDAFELCVLAEVCSNVCELK